MKRKQVNNMAFNRKNKTITTSGGQEVSSDLFETNKLKKYDDEE
ncbi:hypothetical protein FACS1894166_08180 [Bacilli bacterium]|nr:hypothetical protein FACS1894166_08180 [Bacilli bacterium]